MLAVLLSFGAVNSLIPLLIIIMLIAAAAGLTRGYDLFAIFGIGTLVGAASAAKKGSVVGRNPYRAVVYKSPFMPSPKNRKQFKEEREERKKNKETAKRIVNDIDQQLKSKEKEETKSEEKEEKEENKEIEKETVEGKEEENEEIEEREKRIISRILKTGNYFENPEQKGKYVKLAETAAKVSVPKIETPYNLNKLKHNEEIRKAARAEVKNSAMAEREQYLENLATTTAEEIAQLVVSKEWGKMSEKEKIALVENEFVRPVKGQRSKIAMAGALLRGDIKGLKEEFNKAPSSTKALIGIVGAFATGAGAVGARKVIINELKKMPNYGAQTQPESSEVKVFGGPQVEVFGDRILKGFSEEKSQPEAQGKRDIKSQALVIIELTSLVFLSPIGWLAVREIRKGYERYNKRKQ